MESNGRLARTLYRSVLRWSKSNADVPFSLRSADLQVVVPTLQHVDLALHDSDAVAQIARAAFRDSRDLQGPDAEAALERGLDALRALNTSYASLLATARRVRADRADRTGVEHRVGQVFVHRKFGYRGVIYGWDRRCGRDAEWAAQMSANPAQPFYYALPDEADCVRLFGGVRLTKYVAQDNVEILEGARVVHRALDSYFSGFSERQGRYIPTRKLQYEYPDEYTTGGEVLRPAGEDANLLLHAEEGGGGGGEEGAAAAAAGGGGGGGGGRAEDHSARELGTAP